MITRNSVLVCVVFGGILVFIAALVIDDTGRRKIGIPYTTQAYEFNGKYYWTYRGNHPMGEPDKEITWDQYRTFSTYRDIARLPFLLAVLMVMPAGGYLIISSIVSQASSKGKRGP
jgi:hypothetical protein